MTRQTVVFDLDNTLVNNPEGRDPLLFKASRAYPSIDALMELIVARKEGYKVIMVTCRSSAWRWRTMRWLRRFGIEPDALYMRPTFFRGDDIEVKRDLIHESFEDGYRPVLAFEDNEEVAEMYRELGIVTITPEQLSTARDEPVKWEEA